MTQTEPLVALRDSAQLDGAMKARGFSNRSLADAAELGLGTVAGLRAGSRTRCEVWVARRLCRCLDVDVALLFMPHDERRAA